MIGNTWAASLPSLIFMPIGVVRAKLQVQSLMKSEPSMPVKY